MLKKSLFFVVALVCVIAGMAAIGGANKSSAQSMNVATGTTLVLNLYDTSHGVNWADTVQGGYWSETYNDNITSIQFGEFVFSHLPAGPGAAFGGSYWDGFTIGTNGDSTNYGYADTTSHSGSQDWVGHQWGVMAGGGLDASYNTVKGDPYLIAYWGYHMEPEWWHMHFGDIPPEPMHCLTVHLEDNALFTPQEVYICNHPWPYYGNIYGDGFAKPLNEPGSYFILKINALDEDSLYIGTVIDTLAVYDPNYPNSVRQKDSWHRVDLSKLPSEVKMLYFTMETTDFDPQWGPNTAVYFNLDKLKVVKQDGTANTAVAQKTKAASTLKATTAPKLAEVKDYFPMASYTGGDVTIHDAKGNLVLKTTVKAGEKINLSKLHKGEYRLKHGHKVIPIIKK